MLGLRNLPATVVIAASLATLAWPQDAEELFRRGERFFAGSRPNSAIDALQRSVQLRPGFAPAWKALGVVYASRGEFERAETAFRNACEREPTLRDACLYYGRALYLQNHFEPAIDVLHHTVRREPENGEAYRLLALSAEALGRAVEARDAFREALRHNGGAAPEEDAGIDYAVFLFRQGRAEDAIEPLEAVLKRHPDAARAHLELGCIQLALDRLPAAAAHLERSVALDAASGRAHLLLGKVYLRQGKSQAAEEHLRQGSLTVK